VLLAWNKVGKYTAEEFEKAFGAFTENQKPFIFTYFKPSTTKNRAEIQSLWEFEDKLNELKHYKTPYETIEGLREHFGNQLDKLAKNGFELLGRSPEQKADGVTNGAATVTDNRKTYNIEHINQAEFS
jgi:hypothetical protein